MEFTESNILYCKAFRRLGDKTQMINYHHQVHFRNRMTHSMEVSAIADEIAKRINKNNDIVDRVLLREMCLVHDFGHTPFGHTGERKINNLLKETGFCFKHNVFSFKLLKYNFENVRWEVLDAVLKHTKVFYSPELCSFNHKDDIYDIKNDILELLNQNEILGLFFQESGKHCYLDYMEHKEALSLEGQILSISDEIAQRASDLDDAFRIIRLEKVPNNEKEINNYDNNLKIDITNDEFF